MIKSSILTLLSTIIKLFTNLVITKFVSLNFGSPGIVRLANFQNFFQIVTNVSSGGINNGIIKYTSEYSKKGFRLTRMLKSVVLFIASCTIISLVIILVNYKILSKKILGSEDNSYIIVISAFSLILFSANTIYTSILNGLGKIRLLTFVNVLQSIFGLLVTIICIKYLNYNGFILSIPISQFGVFLSLVVVLYSAKKMLRIIVRSKIESTDIMNLLSYSAMTLTAAIVMPFSMYYVRTHIEDFFGTKYAGIWQASQYISTTHLYLLTTSLSVYFLPTFSKISDFSLIRKEVIKGLKFIWIIVSISSIVLFLLKDNLIEILFSREFNQLTDYIFYQIISDILKITSWLFAYLLIAKSKMTIFIILELLNAGIYILGVTYLPHFFGFKGVFIASIFQYTSYLFFMIMTFRKLNLFSWTKT